MEDTSYNKSNFVRSSPLRQPIRLKKRQLKNPACDVAPKANVLLEPQNQFDRISAALYIENTLSKGVCNLAITSVDLFEESFAFSEGTQPLTPQISPYMARRKSFRKLGKKTSYGGSPNISAIQWKSATKAVAKMLRLKPTMKELYDKMAS